MHGANAPTPHPVFETHCSSARRTLDVQVFGAICINIYETVQAIAAVMVTVATVMVTVGALSTRCNA